MPQAYENPSFEKCPECGNDPCTCTPLPAPEPNPDGPASDDHEHSVCITCFGCVGCGTCTCGDLD